MRLSEECVCGGSIAAVGRRRHAQFVWAMWREKHTDCIAPIRPEEEPEKMGSHADTQLARSQDGRWIGGWDYIPQVDMRGGLHV